jgi:hypothetical protein
MTSASGCCRISAPASRVEELSDSIANLVANAPDVIEWFPPGIFQRPIVTLEARYDGTLIAASHCDQQLSSLRQLVREL